MQKGRKMAGSRRKAIAIEARRRMAFFRAPGRRAALADAVRRRTGHFVHPLTGRAVFVQWWG